MREGLAIGWDAFLALCCVVGLFAWAAWRSGKIGILRFFGNNREAKELGDETDRQFRQLAGLGPD